VNNPKLITEFLGTFFLVSVVAFTGNPLAIGAVLCVLVYASGHISGAHFNPAVTFAFYLKKMLSAREAVSYVVAQFLGGIAAMLFYSIAYQDQFIPQPGKDISIPVALVVEAVFTFLLVRTILLVTGEPKLKGNQFFGLAIGGALMVAAFTGGPVSGGAFNPAVGISPLLFDITSLVSYLPLIVLYSVGPLVGAWLAVTTEKRSS
jgi:aquaporin Z